LGEGSRQNKYPDHQKDIFIRSTSGEMSDPFTQTEMTGHGDSCDGRDHESDSDRYFIKIIGDKRSDQIDTQKYK